VSGIKDLRSCFTRLFQAALLLFFCTGSIRASAVDFVWVDKSERRMYLYDNGTLIREYVVALGKNPYGHKQQRGDKRTPEGTYLLDFIKENSSFYRAMHISYPNSRDRHRASQLGVSPGGSIMIHGQPNREGWNAQVAQEFNWTNGCIALTNAEMDDFLGLVNVGTPIQIEW